MPPRITPASWGRRLTPAQRQRARRQRLRAQQQANQRLDDDGFCVPEYHSEDEYLAAREAELRAYFPFEPEEDIRELARCLPPGKLPPPPTRERAWQQHLDHRKWREERKRYVEDATAEYMAQQAEMAKDGCEPYFVDDERLAQINPPPAEPASIDDDDEEDEGEDEESFED